MPTNLSAGNAYHPTNRNCIADYTHWMHGMSKYMLASLPQKICVNAKCNITLYVCNIEHMTCIWSSFRHGCELHGSPCCWQRIGRISEFFSSRCFSFLHQKCDGPHSAFPRYVTDTDVSKEFLSFDFFLYSWLGAENVNGVLHSAFCRDKETLMGTKTLQCQANKRRCFDWIIKMTWTLRLRKVSSDEFCAWARAIPLVFKWMFWPYSICDHVTNRYKYMDGWVGMNLTLR